MCAPQTYRGARRPFTGGRLSNQIGTPWPIPEESAPGDLDVAFSKASGVTTLRGDRVRCYFEWSWLAKGGPMQELTKRSVSA